MKTKQLLAMAVGALATSALGLAAGGSVSAVPDPDSYPVGEIEIDSIGPTCLSGFPYIAYDISAVSTIGDPLEPGDLTADITIVDINGNVVEELADQPLSGVILWPGASIDPPDWPGWENGPNGWVPDPSDEVLREPLTIIAEVNPTASATVEYPSADSGCANPEILPPATTTTIAAVLPPTGADGVGQSLMISATIAVAGIGLVLVSRRRRQQSPAAV